MEFLLIIMRSSSYAEIWKIRCFVIPKTLSAFVFKWPVLYMGRPEVCKDFSGVCFCCPVLFYFSRRRIDWGNL